MTPAETEKRRNFSELFRIGNLDPFRILEMSLLLTGIDFLILLKTRPYRREKSQIVHDLTLQRRLGRICLLHRDREKIRSQEHPDITAPYVGKFRLVTETFESESVSVSRSLVRRYRKAELALG